MHHKRPVPRQIDRMFRHDYLAVEVGIKSDHERRITWNDYARKTIGYGLHLTPSVRLCTCAGNPEVAVRAD